jgi:hypothetical protein
VPIVALLVTFSIGAFRAEDAQVTDAAGGWVIGTAVGLAAGAAATIRQLRRARSAEREADSRVDE